MRISFTILLLSLSVIAYAQSDQVHSIDKEYHDCLKLDKNSTTKGRSDCVINATIQWDTQLNDTYNQLLKLLTAGQKETLKTAQRKWIEYRDKELAFSNQLYHALQGTMWIPVAAQTKLTLTKQRAIELNGYVESLTIDR